MAGYLGVLALTKIRKSSSIEVLKDFLKKPIL